MMDSAPAVLQLGDVVAVVPIVLVLYFVLYKSALIRLWWPLVGWALEPLGFRVVVMDMSFHLYAIRWVPPEGRA